MLTLRFFSRSNFLLYLSLALTFFVSTKLSSYTEILEAIQGSKYIFCVEGGASKTDLKVLNELGEELPLSSSLDDKTTFALQGPCTNITFYQEKDVKKALISLLKNIYIGKERIPAESIIKESALIAGFGGSGRKKGMQSLQNIVEKIGFPKEKTCLFSDAGISLELTQDSGAILIAGTGSICFIRENGVQKRRGGLGYRLTDEGSGYMIGIAAIKAAIENEYDPNEMTSLTGPIKDLFKVQDATQLIQIINNDLETPRGIAAAAGLVFKEALNGDSISQKILKNASDQLGSLLAKSLQKVNLKNPLVYLVGGMFQCTQAEQFIEDIYSSDAMKSLSEDNKPLLVNLSKEVMPAIAVQEALRSKSTIYAESLSSLPVMNQASCKEFKKKFHLGFVTTEKQNPEAANLSQVFNNDQQEGLELLQRLDHGILLGAEVFIENNLEQLQRTFLNKIQKKGRIFFIGSGSSGRIALDLAAKWRDFFTQKSSFLPSYLKDSVHGIIAGGAYSFVKAREGFEDSTISGYETLKNAGFNSNDIAVLISASGTAHFNIGAANYASESEGECYYFYNSSKVPERTQTLFDKGIVKPLLIDIGPQSITGSTRLQASTLTELCMGAVLECMLEKLTYGNHLDAKKVGYKLLHDLQASWHTVYESIPEISKVVDLEAAVFQNPDANFWKMQDQGKQGFVTFLAATDSLREIMIDTTETAPTFSTNPPRDSKTEIGRKRAEFRAFLTGDQENKSAWEDLLRLKLTPDELNDTADILLSSSEKGYTSYGTRIETEGNLLVGVLKSSQTREKALELISELRMAKYRGLKVAAILLEEKKNPFEKEALQMAHFCDAFVLLRDIPKDYLGITSSLALKQTLNLISNASMIKMNKLYGNTMIDVSPSNNKLIDRSIRIIQQIYSEHHPKEDSLDYEMLFQFVTRAHQYKKLVEAQFNKHVPPCTKLILTMLEKKCSILDAINFLQDNQENIHKLYEK